MSLLYHEENVSIGHLGMEMHLVKTVTADAHITEIHISVENRRFRF